MTSHYEKGPVHSSKKRCFSVPEIYIRMLGTKYEGKNRNRAIGDVFVVDNKRNSTKQSERFALLCSAKF